jgi:hypothetical protein
MLTLSKSTVCSVWLQISDDDWCPKFNKQFKSLKWKRFFQVTYFFHHIYLWTHKLLLFCCYSNRPSNYDNKHSQSVPPCSTEQWTETPAISTCQYGCFLKLVPYAHREDILDNLQAPPSWQNDYWISGSNIYLSMQSRN